MESGDYTKLSHAKPIKSEITVILNQCYLSIMRSLDHVTSIRHATGKTRDRKDA